MYTPCHTTTATPKTTAAHIRKHLKTDAIYWFSHQKTTECSGISLFPQMGQKIKKAHYGLLILAPQIPNNFIADMTETIKQQSFGTCTVTLIACETSAIQHTGVHQWFLHNIMTKSFRLYRRRSQRMLLRFPKIPTRNPQKIESHWNQRKYLATCFLEAETAIENPNGDTVQVALMHQAVEHLCLGLIDVFLGHRPSDFGLCYLLQLCDVFTPLAASIFPRNTAEDERLLRVLSVNHHTLRHKPYTETSITDVEVLRKRVNAFRHQAQILAEQELERLRQLPIENETTNL